MTAPEIWEHVQTAPFQPFMIYLSDGRNLRIDHPDQILLTQQSAFVGVGRIGAHYASTGERISLAHVTSIKEITRKVTKTKSD